tara:strand:+ start:5707 stop:6162 length:456 start_codon:yes stop_codon:yes gene_type:complete
MKLFRFFEDRTAYLTNSKYDSGVYKINDYEGYSVDPHAVGMFFRSRFFGFMKPKKEMLITVRVGDGTPLYPLNKNYLSDRPLTFGDLKRLDNASFIKTQFDVESGKKDPNERIALLIVKATIGFAVIFGLLLIPKIIPYAKSVLEANYGVS